MSRSPRSPSLLLTVLAAACAGEPERPTGQLGIALLANAPGGTSYRLPTGTRLEARSGTFFESHSLDGDQPTITLELPVGDVELTLAHDLDFGGLWPLTRIEPDGSQTVGIVGTLLTPQPTIASIQADTTASLVLTFRVAASGTITFSQGALAVSADVEVAAATGALLSLGSANLAIAEATIHPDAPGSLDAYWPAAGAGGLFISLSGTVGQWSQRSSSRVCAPFAQTGVNASPGTSFQDLILESLGATGELCVYAAGGAQFLELLMTRAGPAVTSALGALGPREHRFVTRFAAALPEPVFVDGTLDLARLDWSHEGVALSGGLEVGEVTPDGLVPWYAAALAGTASFTFRPTAD